MYIYNIQNLSLIPNPVTILVNVVYYNVNYVD